jgi:hypothetical protein
MAQGINLSEVTQILNSKPKLESQALCLNPLSYWLSAVKHQY